MKMLNVALPKGRMGDEACALFLKNGFGINAMNDSRELISVNEITEMRFFFVKPSDVPVYVEKGVADIGIAGKDTLIESEADVYELLDLKIGNCKIVVASPKDYRDNKGKSLRVATKYVNIAKKYYRERNREVEVIKLNGSIELAPILGLSDLIVDIIETGKTLKANNLEILEEIMPISARLVANKSSCKFKNSKIEDVREKIERSLKK